MLPGAATTPGSPLSPEMCLFLPLPAKNKQALDVRMSQNDKKSHWPGRRPWWEKNEVAGLSAAPSPSLLALVPGRIFVFLVCWESLCLIWGHASDGGGRGRKTLWGASSPGSTEACKHLMIPRQGSHSWFTSNRGKLQRSEPGFA